jgi:DNA polymerase V
LSLEEVQPNKKAIATTRTFGYEVSCLAEMEEAVAAYVSRSADKLRKQKSLASYIQVFVETNPFKDTPYYRNSAGIDVNPPTAYTPRLIEVAHGLLKRIYRDGLRYKSCGVFLMNLCHQTIEQNDLFEEKYQGSSRERLMQVMDRYNRGANSGKLFMAAEGLGKPWFMKQAHKSKRFTTRWDELLEINI